MVGTDETRETSKGNSRSGARSRPRVPGHGGGKELNRGLGATSEEMVGGRRIGEDQALGTGKRGKEDEDEDADEDADQENEEEEVTEQEKEEEGEGGGRTSGGIRRDAAGDSVARGVGVVAPLVASALPAWSRGAGAGLNPLSSRREVPMNFATLNKKWFHEVNISVTIPSPTRDAHARTHARTDTCTYGRMYARTTRQRQRQRQRRRRRRRRAGSDGRVYTYTYVHTPYARYARI